MRIALAFVCSGLIAGSLSAQEARSKDKGEYHDRGRTQLQDERYTLNRGRIGTQDAMPNGPQRFSGVLIDAGCRDRSAANIGRTPSLNVAQVDPGAKVQEDPKAKEEAARAGVADHLTPDHLTRDADPTCAINGSTKGFALWMPEGRLVMLNEAGNTLAWQEFQNSAAGQSVLDGKNAGAKPRAVVTGDIRGDKLRVQSLMIQ